MNQNVLSGLTATLFLTTLGLPLTSSANPAKAVDQVNESTLDQASNQMLLPDSIQDDVANKPNQRFAQAPSNDREATTLSAASKLDLKLTHAVVKLGEQQSQTTNAATANAEAITKVQAHDLGGRKAATLYVRSIPILTFTSSSKTTAVKVKMGSRQFVASTATADAIENSKAFDASLSATSEALPQPTSGAQADAALSQSDPVLRAAAIAAKINQLSREGIDAKAITVSWNVQANKAVSKGESYAIKANKILIAVVDASTVLSDSTHNLEKDALQATNRLRRLLGNASPLSSVSGKPNHWSQAAVGSIRLRISGLASWYGPGFHGNPSASGELFNQNAMTAAHRSLPFGTQVLVTNLGNGQSVVVRINDRGPYSGDRVIDLSTAAARVLGLIQSGVAQVRLDVLDNSSRAMTAAGN